MVIFGGTRDLGQELAHVEAVGSEIGADVAEMLTIEPYLGIRQDPVETKPTPRHPSVSTGRAVAGGGEGEAVSVDDGSIALSQRSDLTPMAGNRDLVPVAVVEIRVSPISFEIG